MAVALKGRKSSSSTSRKATRHDDTLYGQDTVELLLAISEGPISGLVDGAASFRVGDVPLLDKGTQTPNISNFELRLLKGTNPADSIRLNLGGLASSKNVGLDLRVKDQSIVVQGDKTQIDYLDLRFVVQRLFAVSAEGGEFPFDVSFRVEVKPRSSGVWEIPFNNEPPPPIENTSGASNYRPGSSTPGTLVNDTYRETYLRADAPPAGKAVGAVWFNTGTEFWRPSLWDGAAWVEPADLSASSQHGYYPVWAWTDPDGSTRSAWYSPAGSAPPPGTLARGDYLLTPQAGSEVYSYNETSWVGTQDFATPEPAAPGIIRISGLARSSYPKEYRIPVARINEPYDMRVTRLDPASDKSAFRDIHFESIQEVNRDVVSFPDLAVAWLTIKATDTFNSIPDFTGVYRGVVIPVPSNHLFNEETKLSEFPGLWDGTFKLAYTNNPAWHAYNFIKNSRYGKNAYFPEVPDPWDFYEFGKHCSAHGFRFNEYIQDPRSLNELINYIVGIAGGRYVDRGDGYSTVIWDADNQVAQAIFAPENTIEGSFNYSFTDVTERKNDFKVSFKNPALNYREDRVRVWDQNTIDVQGRNAEEFVAVGCRDSDEAVRRGRLRLATALTEKIIVNFKTNRLGRYLLPFQVILIADDQSTNVISGRVKNADPTPVGASRLPLRDQIYLEAGIEYQVQFTVSDGNGGLKVVTYPLTVTTPGLQSELRLSRALAEALPEYAVFSIGTPKAFRITSITPADDEPDQVEITAIEVNRLKWAFVDGKVELRDLLPLQTGALSKFVYPVTGAKIVPETTLAGQLNLVATWNPSETKLTRGYRVYQSLNGQPMELVAEPSDTLYRIENVKAATYVLSIVAVGLDGTTESAPVTVSYIIASNGSLRSVSAPTNLRLVDEPEAPIFRAIDPRFTWDAAADPLVTKYRVEVLNGASQVVHSETVENLLLFTYSLAANRADNGGTPLRQFTVQVRAIDMLGNLSQPASLVVSHPAPQAPTFELSAVSEVVFVETTQPTGDWAGTLVWMEKVSGFNPATTPPKADNRSTFFPMPAEAEQTYYVRVAAYDSYGKTGLNYSVEKLIKATIKLFDPLAPPIPGVPTLVSNVAEVAPDGTVTSKVTITWPGVISDNLGTYEVAIAEGNNPAEAAYVGGRFSSGGPMAFAGLMPGRVYSLKLRSNPKNGFADSGWSPILVVTAALNTTPPNAPTLFTADPSFEAANLAWTNPSIKDLLGVEVWAGATNVLANATLLKTVPAPAAFYRDVLSTSATKFYWIRAVNTSDFKSGFVGPLSVTSVALAAAQLAAGVIDATKLASSIAANTVVTTLPTTKTTDFVTLGGEQYRWDAAANKYTKAVASTDISGKIVAAQIDTVNKEAIATALAQSAIQTSQLSGNLDAARISGTLTSDQIASLNAAKVAGTLTAANIDFARLLGTIAGTQIAAGSIVGSKLAVVSTNMAFNPDASQGRRGWTIGGSMPAGVDAGVSAAWAPDGFRAIFTSSTATAAVIGSSYIDLYTQNVSADGVTSNYTTSAGTTYEFSACISAHRCTGRVIVQWLNSSGGHISFSDNASRVVNQAVSGGSYTAFPKSTMIAVAPTGAVSARVFFRMDSTVGDNPYMFVSAFMMAATRTGATETSPYVAPGVTTIDGSGIVSGSITTRVLAASAVTADQIAANAVTATKILAGSVQTGHMVAGTIDANRLVAASITAGLLAANSVTADKVAANSITASKILVADTTNALLNGHFLNQSSEGWALYGDTGIDVASADDPGGQWRLTGTTEMYLARGTQWIQVTPGEILYFSTMIYNNRNAGNAGIYLEFYNQAEGGGHGAFTATRSEKGSWVKGEGQVAVPAGRQKVRVVLYADAPGTGRTYFGKVQVRRANGAELIVDGAITTNKLVANAVTSDKITANAITTAHISAGAIKADQLDVGAVTAAKLGVGLNTGNLIWNSEGTADGLNGPANGTQPNAYCDMPADWKVNGSVRSIRLHHPNPTNGNYTTTDIQNPAAGGGYTWEIPVQGGKRYEFSCYVSVHGPCRAYIQAHFNDGNGFFPGNTSNIMNTNGRQGAPGDDWRCKIMVDAPGTAQKVLLRLVVEYQGTSACWGFFSGFYLGIAGTNATAFSEWTLQSRTVISGGQISTNSLNANRIVARTITADRLALRTILAENLVAGTITGEEIAVGGVHANRIQSNTITATQIAANSISASRLNIEVRGIMPVNVYFEMERDGNGNATGWLKWTAGQIEYIDHNGNRAFSQVPAGRMQRGSDGWVTVWFNIAAPGQLQANSGNNIPGIRADPNCILVATSADLTGVIVNWGGTVIDGDKIVANSIQARNIAANQIQTGHMAANSINGDRIAAGTISADKITTGTLTVNAVFSLGSNSQTDMYAHPNGGVFRVRNRQLNQWRAAFGYIGDWTGDGNDFGLLLWGADGANRLRFSNAVNFIDGVIISDASIQNAKIANLTIGNEKVQNDAITNGAASIGGAFQRDREVWLNIRRPGTRVGIWVSRTGNPSTMSLASSNPGLLRTLVARPGQGWGDIRQIPNAFTFEYVGNGNAIRHMPTSDMSHYTCDVAGSWGFRVIDDSNSDASAASITVIEFSK